MEVTSEKKFALQEKEGHSIVVRGGYNFELIEHKITSKNIK